MNRPHWRLKTLFNLARRRSRSSRRLEIGPGPHRVPGFQTFDAIGGPGVDYVGNAADRLPFREGTFELIYASHVLEHVPWFMTEAAVREWVRVLEVGGELEIWVPNGLLVCKTLVDFECEGINAIDRDGWYRFNPDRDPCVWASGRLFTYGSGIGDGDPGHPNWHRAIFTPRYLRQVMVRSGLEGVVEMDRSEVRGYDHGWINLGMKGRKSELSEPGGPCG